MSMMTALTRDCHSTLPPSSPSSPCRPLKLEFLYSTKAETRDDEEQVRREVSVSEILFLDRLLAMASSPPGRNDDDSDDARPYDLRLQLFLTGPDARDLKLGSGFPAATHPRRISTADVLSAVGEDADGRGEVAAYVCGPPRMTDEMVGFLKGLKGVRAEWVLCEKWW
ncbi:hypothetical protein BDY21DRAFT_332011 [Lineolata rhizophorae]|uniref:Oxidoreductase FAD/NAD(P)-binding domain-containing protein n=1 Tax=Lineolata rhizophorae TaxID=578093 RepID=A0A6A6PBR1_9PEZI|nr:hypothetical protein BDY21DRAFT_332011 [Lineolata rhizophorae]